MPTSLAHTVGMTVADLPGVPETALPEGLRERLPAQPPAAPWHCDVEAVLWWHRAAPGSAALLPPELVPGPPLTLGAFVRYLSTPVGPYEEVLACPHLLAGALRAGVLAHLHVPFIAVDSLPSIAGGRVCWSLPKTLAAFTRTGPAVRAEGDGWFVSATARPTGPALPAPGRLATSQLTADRTVRRATTRSTGRARLASVEVATSDGLAPWLLPGRHRGLVLRSRLRVGAAAPGRPGSPGRPDRSGRP